MLITLPHLARLLSHQTQRGDPRRETALPAAVQRFQPGQVLGPEVSPSVNACVVLSGLVLHDAACAQPGDPSPRFSGPGELLTWQCGPSCDCQVRAITTVRVLVIPWCEIRRSEPFKGFFDSLPAARAATGLLRDVRFRNRLGGLPVTARIGEALRQLRDMAGVRHRTQDMRVVLAVQDMARWVQADMLEVRLAIRSLANAGVLDVVAGEIRRISSAARTVCTQCPCPAAGKQMELLACS